MALYTYKKDESEKLFLGFFFSIYVYGRDSMYLTPWNAYQKRNVQFAVFAKFDKLCNYCEIFSAGYHRVTVFCGSQHWYWPGNARLKNGWHNQWFWVGVVLTLLFTVQDVWTFWTCCQRQCTGCATCWPWSLRETAASGEIGPWILLSKRWVL